MIKKRTAVCLFGLHALECLKGATVDNIVYQNWKDNFIDVNSDSHVVDFFVHSWTQNPDLQHDILTTFKPKKYAFQKQIIFDKQYLYNDNSKKTYQLRLGYGNMSYGEVTYSHCYSAMKCVELLDGQPQYDVVCLARLDLLWLKPLMLCQLVDLDNNVYVETVEGVHTCVSEQFNNELFVHDSVYISNYDNILLVSLFYSKLHCPLYVKLMEKTFWSVCTVKMRYYYANGLRCKLNRRFVRDIDTTILRRYTKPVAIE